MTLKSRNCQFLCKNQYPVAINMTENIALKSGRATSAGENLLIWRKRVSNDPEISAPGIIRDTSSSSSLKSPLYRTPKSIKNGFFANFELEILVFLMLWFFGGSKSSRKLKTWQFTIEPFFCSRRIGKTR